MTQIRSRFHKTVVYQNGVVISEIPKETFHAAMVHKPLGDFVGSDQCSFWFLRDPEWPSDRYRCFKVPKLNPMADLGLHIHDTWVTLSPGDIAAIVMALE